MNINEVLLYIIGHFGVEHSFHFLLNEKIDDKFIRTMKSLDILIYQCSASNINQGCHLSDIFKGLLEMTNGDIQKAQNAVVIIEDFEKMSMDERFIDSLIPEGTSLELRKAMIDIEKLVRYENQVLLSQYLSHGIISVEYQGKEVFFNTSNLSFIMTGDYKDLDKTSILAGYDENLCNQFYGDECGIKSVARK